jgi:hypothetical protein
MVQITDMHREYNPIGLPFGYRIVGTNYKKSGQKNSARFYLDHTPYPNNSDYFFITINGTKRKFLFVSSPDDSGFQLTAGEGLVTLYNELTRNSYVNDYFELALNPDHILFTTRQAGAPISFSFDNGPHPNVGYLQGQTVYGGDEYAENYRIYIQLRYWACKGSQFPLSGDIKEIGLLAEPDKNGVLDLELSALCKNLMPELAMPSFWKPILLDYAIQLSPYFAEFYGTEPETKKLYNSVAYCYVLPSKLDRDSMQFMGETGKHPEVLTTNSQRRTHPGSFEVVTIFNNLLYNTPDCWPIFDVDYADGSQQSIELTGLKKNLGYQSAMVFPVGLDVFCTSLQQAWAIKRVRLRFKFRYDDQDLQETITRILDKELVFTVLPRTYDLLNFLFINRYGAWETAIFFAGQTGNLSTERQQYIVPGSLPDIQNPQTVSAISNCYESFEASTGYLPPGESLEAAKDFLATSRAYLVENGQFVRIDLLSKDLETGPNEGLRSIKFKYRYSNDYLC